MILRNLEDLIFENTFAVHFLTAEELLLESSSCNQLTYIRVNCFYEYRDFPFWISKLKNLLSNLDLKSIYFMLGNMSLIVSYIFKYLLQPLRIIFKGK